MALPTAPHKRAWESIQPMPKSMLRVNVTRCWVASHHK